MPGFWQAVSSFNPVSQASGVAKTFMYIVGFIVVLIIVLIFAGTMKSKDKMTNRGWVDYSGLGGRFYGGPAIAMQDVDDPLIGSNKPMKPVPSFAYAGYKGFPTQPIKENFSYGYQGSQGTILSNPGHRYFAMGNIGGQRYGVYPSPLVRFDRPIGH